MPDDDAQGTETTSHDPSSLDTTEDPTASLGDLPEDAEGYLSSTETADEGGALEQVAARAGLGGMMGAGSAAKGTASAVTGRLGTKTSRGSWRSDAEQRDDA